MAVAVGWKTGAATKRHSTGRPLRLLVKDTRRAKAQQQPAPRRSAADACGAGAGRQTPLFLFWQRGGGSTHLKVVVA